MKTHKVIAHIEKKKKKKIAELLEKNLLNRVYKISIAFHTSQIYDKP